MKALYPMEQRVKDYDLAKSTSREIDYLLFILPCNSTDPYVALLPIYLSIEID